MTNPDRVLPTGLTEHVFAQLSALDWDFDGLDTSSGGHGGHPYPARFPPQLPAQLIEKLTTEHDLVIDPFGGSGTTALEALRLNRRVVSIDANPVAARLTRIKTEGLTAEDRSVLVSKSREVHDLLIQLERCTDDYCPARASVPQIRNITKWFNPISVHELAHIRTIIDRTQGRARDALELAVGQVAARVSFQDSETRYVSVPRPVEMGEAIALFEREISRLVIREEAPDTDCDSLVVEGDARAPGSWSSIEAGSASLVVTSPPYPNAYDYHLYHRFRLLWTERDPVMLRRVEIGSHLRQQTVADPEAEYEADIQIVLEHALRALKPNGWCAMVVGDGIYAGKRYGTAERVSILGDRLNYEVAGIIERTLPTTKRSVTAAGRRLASEQIVLLRKHGPARITLPEWPLFDYEVDLGSRELQALLARGTDLRQLTFASKIVHSDSTIESTLQSKLESTSLSRRKNSTYASHGIHRYKGKFYPQLGRSLINLSCTDEALVVDPFAGSGTVALESSLLGHRYHAIELSPVGAATAKAKIAALSIKRSEFDHATRGLQELLKTDSKRILDWNDFEEGVRDELASWFAPTVLARIGRVKSAISMLTYEQNISTALLAKVCLSDLIRDVSHQDPSDLRIRRRSDPLTDAPVEDLFLRRWTTAVQKVTAAQQVLEIPLGTGTIVTGDATDVASWRSSNGDPIVADAVVSSPPYAAALPYLDTDRLSLAAVFGESKSDRAHLERSLVGSREITSADLDTWRDRLRNGSFGTELPSSTTSFLEALQEAVIQDKSAGFRRQQGPSVLTRYFVAMSNVLKLVAGHLRPGGQAWFVVGDSSTTLLGEKWIIPTTAEIAAIGKQHGLALLEEIPISVTRENMRHARHAITRNTLLHFEAPR